MKNLTITVTLFGAEDADLIAHLRSLGRYDRARRARGLLRAGRAAERGESVNVAPATQVPVAADAPVVSAASLLDGGWDPRSFTFQKEKPLCQ